MIPSLSECIRLYGFSKVQIKQYNKGYEDAKKAYGSLNLNAIIMSTIEWITENDIVPEIIFYSVGGGNHLILKLSKGNNHMVHDFYIPCGVLSAENWKSGHCDIELDIFLENAKKQFAIQDQERKR